MTAKLKRRWRELRAGEPGRRFQDGYRRRHARSAQRGRRIALLGAGAVLVLAGLFLLPAPGPGTVVLVLGAGLMAEESLAAARVLDWVELRVRGAAEWGLAAWRRAGIPAKAAIVLLTAAAAGGAGFLAYRVLF